jgi:bifunctional non-homologous end joining protein LigD
VSGRYLHLDGESTRDLPYLRRRDLLTGLGLVGETVRVPAHFVDVDGRHVLTAAQADGLEGVVAKRLASTYQPGRRSRDWVKTPLNRTQEVVIIGYKPGGGRRSGTLGSLVLAVPDRAGALIYTGGVGTGFTARMLDDLHRKLAPLRRPTPPAEVPRDHGRGVVWVEPVLVGEIEHRNRIRTAATGTPPGAAYARPQPPRHSATGPRTRGTHLFDGTNRPSLSTARCRPRTEPGASKPYTGTSHWYRVIHGDDTIDWLTVADVERLLQQAGVDISALHDADPAA